MLASVGTTLMLAVFVGAAQNIISKAASTAFDPVSPPIISIPSPLAPLALFHAFLSKRELTQNVYPDRCEPPQCKEMATSRWTRSKRPSKAAIDVIGGRLVRAAASSNRRSSSYSAPALSDTSSSSASSSPRGSRLLAPRRRIRRVLQSRMIPTRERASQSAGGVGPGPCSMPVIVMVRVLMVWCCGCVPRMVVLQYRCDPGGGTD